MKPSRLSFDQAAFLTASHQLLGPSSSRYGIWFFPPAGAKATIGADPPVVLGQGIELQQGQAPIWLCTDTHGDCVKAAWHAIYSVGGSTIGIIEVMD